METITMGRYVFELVDSCPHGYEIWNIGKHMPDGYLPFCRLASHQPFPGGRTIETDTLKAVKIEGAQIILEAIGYGQNTVKDMEQYLKRHKNAKPDTFAYAQVKRIRKALPIMKQIKGLKEGRDLTE